MSVGLLALLDDVVGILDDVAAMTKKAATKTAGVVADDLAVNAGQVTGSPSDREIPIIKKVALGSLVNKIILVPTVLFISYFMPPVLTLMLILGGLYLCFEGSEKILHYCGVIHEESEESGHELSESEKIKGAIKTDFVLSIEIIVIAMSQLVEYSFMHQAVALSIVGFVMTVAVYGFVALIVRADDMGLWMISKNSPLLTKLGKGIISVMPSFMRFLTVAGTLAMFLVGGTIVSHNVGFLHEASDFIIKYWVGLVDLHTIIESFIYICLGFIYGVITVILSKLK